MNKKAVGYMVLSVFLFGYMAIILLMYFFGNYIFFASPADIRMDEARTISDRLVGAIVEKGELKFFPPPGVTTFDLKMVLRVNFLRSNIILKKAEKVVALLAQSGGDLSRCETRGSGNKVSFK